MPSPFSQYHNWIEQEIRKKKYGNQPESLYEPIRYLMSLGGKRLRPMLTLLAYGLFKQDAKSIVQYAVAVEAFHNFTLMHDDIMDNAPLRRGHKTVHEKWNVNTAILSGDVMLVRVYEMFLDIEQSKLKQVLSAFNKCAAEVCEGQQWDMIFEGELNVSEKRYLNMIKLKTAVLLGFSLELGALLAEAPEADCRALREFGTNIGIGFQLKDDLLDAYGDPKKFGKQIGGDILSNKKTYLLVKALEKASGKQRRELVGWLSAKKFRKQQKIDAVKSIYDSLAIPSLAEKKVNQYFDKGFESLGVTNCPENSKLALKTFAETLISRQS